MPGLAASHRRRWNAGWREGSTGTDPGPQPWSETLLSLPPSYAHTSRFNHLQGSAQHWETGYRKIEHPAIASQTRTLIGNKCEVNP